MMPNPDPQPTLQDLMHDVPDELRRYRDDGRMMFFDALRRRFCLYCGRITHGAPCPCRRDE